MPFISPFKRGERVTVRVLLEILILFLINSVWSDGSGLLGKKNGLFLPDGEMENAYVFPIKPT